MLRALQVTEELPGGVRETHGRDTAHRDGDVCYRRIEADVCVLPRQHAPEQIAKMGFCVHDCLPFALRTAESPSLTCEARPGALVK